MPRDPRTAFLLALALLAAPAAASDEPASPEDKTVIEAEVAYRDSDVEESAFRAAEFESAADRPVLAVRWASSPYSKTLFDLSYERVDYAEQSAAARLDLDRWLTVNAAFEGLLHRLDHDPLTNLQAVSDVKVVRHTDFEPTAEYSIVRHVYDAGIAVRPPAAGWLTVRAGYRDERREGTRQALALPQQNPKPDRKHDEDRT